jgi:uncharacterized RDD family membrane protein YckC
MATSWKQEVSLRLAQHRSRRGLPAAKPVAPARSFSTANSRAAEAAARVAQRYSQVPSYSQMFSSEASVPLPVAWSPAPLAPLPVVQAAPAFLRSAPASPRQWEPDLLPEPSSLNWEPDLPSPQPAKPYSLPTSLEAWENEYSNFGWMPDHRLHPISLVSAKVAAPAPPAVEAFRSDEWDQPVSVQVWENSSLEPVEPDMPIPANLIEFPRELVAARKMRPQRADRLAVQERQLSIFEVAPEAISTEPELVSTAHAAAWPEPEWSGMEYKAELVDEPEQLEVPDPLSELEVAPLGSRLSAALVDGAAITAAGVGMALMAMTFTGHPLTARIAALGAVSAFVFAGLLYHAFFLILAEDTPGMRCAGISLCTFDGRIPTPAELRSRLGALLLSMVPMGLGVAWVLFDEDHLSWHDRLSNTYPRKR